MEKVSIIVPIYNIERYLKECIESILNQTYDNIELILIDDGSTDKSGEICDFYLNNDKVIVVHKENQGVSAARNDGIKKASGKYLLFVDSDDYLNKEMVETLISKNQNYDCTICGFVEKFLYKEIEKKATTEEKTYNSQGIIEQIIKNGNIGGYIFNKLFKKDILQKNNIYFNENIHMCEDMLFVTEYLLKCQKIKIIPNLLYYYRMRKSSAVWNKNNKYFTIFDSYKTILELLEYNDIDKDVLYYKIIFSYYALPRRSRQKAEEKLGIDYSTIFKTLMHSTKINKNEKTKIFILKNFRIIYQIYMNQKIKKLKRFD